MGSVVMKNLNWLSFSFLATMLCGYAGNLFADELLKSNFDSDEPELIQLYTQDELNALILENKHLERVKSDECQFKRDIKDRALVLHYPAYLYLWADMNFTNTCIDGSPKDGVYALQLAVDKGMPAALYKMGGFYLTGTYVQKDYAKAYRYIYNAASLGNNEAKLTLVNLLATHEGNEADYQEAYHWLFTTVFEDKKKHQMAESLLAQLRKKMPPSLVKRAESNY